MHGLVNKAIEAFVIDTYGAQPWRVIAQMCELDDPHFEAMMSYEGDITSRVIDCATRVLKADRSDFLQNLGTYLVSQPSQQAVRRLLRFGGVDFVDFLYSLDDLRDRARLAVSDLHLPRLELREHTSNQFSLTVRSKLDGFGHVLVGLLTAMADDYGALVMLDYGGRRGEVETVAIALLERSFAEGNSFELGARV
ncbi:heme NO-binding domain-containing protein [Planktotalea arctica]|uniref:heme NO-binding domain-containing protein n=1 Tax=Planktotalea arctica TaxID=1481893 RepID=UPI00321B4070